MSESYAELLERLEAAERALRNALDFLSNESHLTDKGTAAREALLEEIEKNRQDLEAIRQEHGLE
jgi:hypothetical protein